MFLIFIPLTILNHDSLADLCYNVNPDNSRKPCKYKHSGYRESVGSISTPPLSRLDLHSCVAFDGILNVVDKRVPLSAYPLVVYQMVCIQH
ncbi:hypothetical protein T08_12997 [Trichinella sp. T8]|nr:hypothetical protein T08_12997 [Trichinella sp. T8]